MKSVCVFCGASKGNDKIYIERAEELGYLLANKGIKLIYGGGGIGLMGVVANSVMDNGGEVIGVMPKFLFDLEIADNTITELIIVESMHERKLKMSQLAEGFVAMPGGFGTLEEICEILTWAQLKLHQYPVGLLNINGYYDQLLGFMDHMVGNGFLNPVNRALVNVENEPNALINKLMTHQAGPATPFDPRKA